MTIAWLLLTAAVASCVLTWGCLRYAIRCGVLDIPNARSSHVHPTARGGGVAIVLVFLVGIPFLWAEGVVSGSFLVAMSGAGLLVAVVGFLDDHWRISVSLRLAAHFVAAGWLLFWLCEVSSANPSQINDGLGWIAALLAAIWIVWLLNLYNFMDGIDAIAGIEAITVCFGGVLLYWLFVPGEILWVLPALLLVAVSGFLCWNFPPARIFMGDAGSGFLGFVFGAMSLHAFQHDPKFLWAWTMLLGVFVVDASVTLIRRVSRGERFLEPHRSHAYQRASRIFGHKPVSLAVGLINLAWLLPLALVVGAGYLDGIVGLVVAYVPLVILAIVFKAGVSDARGREGISRVG